MLVKIPQGTRACQRPPQEFLDYWLNTYGALVREHAAAMNVRRYLQHHTLDDALNEALRAGRGAPQAFDGVAELWWDSKEQMERAFSTPEGRAAGKTLMEDEKTFIDHARSPLWIGEEKRIIGE